MDPGDSQIQFSDEVLGPVFAAARWINQYDEGWMAKTEDLLILGILNQAGETLATSEVAQKLSERHVLRTPAQVEIRLKGLALGSRNLVRATGQGTYALSAGGRDHLDQAASEFVALQAEVKGRFLEAVDQMVADPDSLWTRLLNEILMPYVEAMAASMLPPSQAARGALHRVSVSQLPALLRDYSEDAQANH